MATDEDLRFDCEGKCQCVHLRLPPAERGLALAVKTLRIEFVSDTMLFQPMLFDPFVSRSKARSGVRQ